MEWGCLAALFSTGSEGVREVWRRAAAFQFYVKDWLTSETVGKMPLSDQGIFVRLFVRFLDLTSARHSSRRPYCCTQPFGITLADGPIIFR